MNFSGKRKIREKLLQSFGALKEDAFDFESIEKYFRKKNHSGTFQVISDKTCNDLDLNELFMYVDRTHSKIGQQYLYNNFRTIKNQQEQIDQHEKIIDEMTQNDSFRVFVQALLIRLNNPEAFYITSLFQEEHINRPRWFFMIRILAVTNLFSMIMLFFNPYMFFVILVIVITNILIHYWNKRNLYQYIGSLPQLLKLNSIAKELYKQDLFQKMSPQVSEAIHIVDKVRNRMSFFKLESKLEGEMEAFFWGILELFKILFLLEPLLLFSVLKHLETKRKEIEILYSFVGQIDVLISIASLRKSLDVYCKPVINEKNTKLNAIEVYHPLIPECVKNSIELDKKSVLLTGSNMSGKTTFIRTIGINVLTGLTLNTCFAESFSMPEMRIFSAIRISDNLLNDRSYYFEEVSTIKDMIDQSGTGVPNIFLLDEIFKGTNTVERISAGKAVLSALAQGPNLVFVSTHDIELADLLKSEYDLYHFSEKVDHKTVDFDFILKNGKLKNRNAIRILALNGYPETIINEAVELAKIIDKTDKEIKN